MRASLTSAIPKVLNEARSLAHLRHHRSPRRRTSRSCCDSRGRPGSWSPCSTGDGRCTA